METVMRNIILYTDTPIAGGAEKHIHLLARQLTNDGYNVTVVCSRNKSLDAWVEDMKKDGMKVIRLNVSHKHDPRHLFQLRKIIRELKPDILHIHLWNPGACRYAFWSASPKKIKIVTTEHDPFPLKSLKKRIKKKTLKRTAHTITVSETSYNQMLTLYPELKGKMSVIHNGIDLAAFEKDLVHFSNQEKARIRQQIMKVDANDFVIVSIAALHPRKGLKFLLEAFKEVCEQRNDARLVIIGEGPQKKELEKLGKKLKISDKIRMLGWQENIPRMLKSSDLFVLPSVKEAFGLVLLEAMAAQLPILATKVGGIPEIVQDKKNGILVEPGKSHELSEKILMLISNRPLREKLSFLGHHRVKDFDIREMVQKTKMVYDQLAGTLKSK